MIDEMDAAKLMANYLRREIGKLMQQAEHWDKEGVPLAVHHRMHVAEHHHQIICMLEGFGCGKDKNPFQMMREELARPPMKSPGTYPASQEMHDKYYDPRNLVKTLQARIDAGLKWY